MLADQPPGMEERKINASHSLQMAGTYIHLIALHNGLHNPLIIRLHVRNGNKKLGAIQTPKDP